MLPLKTANPCRSSNGIFNYYKNYLQKIHEDYDRLDETAYLLASPANAKRLQSSIKRVKKSAYEERTLIDE